MRKFYRRLSPTAQYVISETVKVCACVGLIIFVGTAVERAAEKTFAVN